MNSECFAWFPQRSRRELLVNMSILIVDDNEILLILLDKMLQGNHYTTLRATSGADAMKILGDHPEVRLVIADISMPGMSGLELLRQIKQSVTLKNIPVILCSVLSDIENVRQGALLGCHSYLVKPLQRNHLLQKVSQALAATRPAVASLTSIQTKFGVERNYCVGLIKAFQKLLHSQIQVMEAYQQNSDQALPPLLLKQLSEGAALLEAKELEDRISDVSNALETKVNIDSQLMRLTREMRQLYSALQSQIAATPANASKTGTDSFAAGQPFKWV